jgi:hypothetical protein
MTDLHRRMPASLSSGMALPLSGQALKAASVLLALAIASSCSARPVDSFKWVDRRGQELRFVEASPRHEGSEGLFSAGQASKRFVLSSTARLEAGSTIVFELRRGTEAQTAEPRATLSASARADGGSPFAIAAFPLSPGLSRLALALDLGEDLSSVTISAEGDAPSFELLSIALEKPFKGIERDGPELRVSSGFTLAQGQGYSEFSIAHPFAGTNGSLAGGERRGILLRYAPSSVDAALKLSVRRPGGAIASYALRPHPAGTSTVLDGSVVAEDAELITLRAPLGISLGAFFAEDLGQNDYALADLGRVLLSGPGDGDYSVYRWDMIPSVLVFDFKDYATQDKYLKRLAFFVEKIGYRGILLRDGDIAPLHGWNAHDYRAEDLASFFQAAKEKNFPLGAEEKTLESALMGSGVIAQSGSGIVAGHGAIISITRETSDALRWTFAVHESTHAIFFADPEYRKFAQSVWASVEPGERWFWKVYFGWKTYDVASDYLMGNEFQAYLLQQPVSMAEEYFTRSKPAELLEKHPELKAQVEEYMARYGPSFTKRAKQLEDWLFAKYGVKAGRTVFLTSSKK